MLLYILHKLHVENSIAWNDKTLKNSDGQMELLEQHCSNLKKINKLETYFTSTGTTFRSIKFIMDQKKKPCQKIKVCMPMLHKTANLHVQESLYLTCRGEG